MSAATAVPAGTTAPAGCTQIDVTATLGWNTTAFPQVSGATARIDYDPALVGLPGSGSTDAVRGRVTNLSGVTDGLLEAAYRASAGSSGDDQASVALVSLSTPIPTGPFARIRFDCVTGAAEPSVADFSCTAEAAAFDGSPVTPTTCSLALGSGD